MIILKILVLCESLSSLGGSERSAIRFMTGLAKRNNEIIVYTTKIKEEFKSKIQKEIKNVKFREFISNKFYLTGVVEIAIFMPNLENLILQDNPDVIYNIIPTLLAHKCLKIAKKHNIPFVSHVHCDDKQMKFQLNFFMSLFAKQFSNFIFKIYANSDFLIYPSKLAYEMNKNCWTNENYAVITNGINLTTFYQDKKIKKYDVKTVISVGRVNTEKNFKILLEAFTNLSKYNLIIAGDGPLREEYIKEYSKYKNINLVGRISDQELVKSYQKSYLFVLASIFELEGIVTLEAMACGLPIITSNHPNNASKQFIKNNGFLFQYDSCEDLQKKIKTIFEDDKLRENMGGESLKLAQEFSLEKSIEKVEKLFAKLVTENKFKNKTEKSK